MPAVPSLEDEKLKAANRRAGLYFCGTLQQTFHVSFVDRRRERFRDRGWTIRGSQQHQPQPGGPEERLQLPDPTGKGVYKRQGMVVEGKTAARRTDATARLHRGCAQTPTRGGISFVELPESREIKENQQPTLNRSHPGNAGDV